MARSKSGMWNPVTDKPGVKSGGNGCMLFVGMAALFGLAITLALSGKMPDLGPKPAPTAPVTVTVTVTPTDTVSTL